MNIGLAIQILSLPPGGSVQQWQNDVVFDRRKVTLEEFYATWGQSPLVLMLPVTEDITTLPLFLPHSVIQEACAMLSSPLQPARGGIDRQSAYGREVSPYWADLTKTHWEQSL